MHSVEVVQFFDEMFNEKKCHDLCSKYKFMQRSTSKLKGQEFINRLLSKLHSIAKIAILGVLIVKFFDHMSNMLSKFTNQSAQKSSTFPIKASFERSLLT